MIAMHASRGRAARMVSPAFQGHHDSTGAIDRRRPVLTICRTRDGYSQSLPTIHETRSRGMSARRSGTLISASAARNGPVSGRFASGRGAEKFIVGFRMELFIIVVLVVLCAASEATTEERQDKKPRIAGLAVGCFDWRFPDFLHITPSCRDVRSFFSSSFSSSDFSASRTSQVLDP